MSEQMPETCPKCGTHVSIWSPSQGHLVTVACDDAETHDLETWDMVGGDVRTLQRDLAAEKDAHAVTIVARDARIAELERYVRIAVAQREHERARVRELEAALEWIIQQPWTSVEVAKKALAAAAAAPTDAREAVKSETWPYVYAFALAMEEKLRQNRHKGGPENWRSDRPAELLQRVREETDELETEIWRRDWNVGEWWEILGEAADIGNMAMMVADAANALRMPDGTALAFEAAAAPPSDRHE